MNRNSGPHAGMPFLLGNNGSLDSSSIMGHWRDYFPEITGRSESMQAVLQVVSKIARSDSPVLIHGESGTGKELIAAAIHRLSSRSNGRFIPINCSAIPENLLESELFGHVKGAFTGADSRRQGLFELATGGTILLDEIGDMPLRLQSKILRVLQEKQFTPIGSNEIRSTDVRIIAATHVDLEKAVHEQQFRLDLFYRLNVLPIHVPPLRQRQGDVTFLLEHFLRIANSKHAVARDCYFDTEALVALEKYSWPGNVRELQNLVERAVVITGGGVIRLADLPDQYRAAFSHQDEAPRWEPVTPDRVVSATTPQDLSLVPKNLFDLPEAGVDLTSLIENLENSLIMQALERTNHNKNQAARLLGLNRTTLVERIKKRRLAPLNMPSKEL